MADAETAAVETPSGSPEEKDLLRTTKALGDAVSIMARLRGPGGCPWDREQNFDTIKRYTLEETYEVFDAIERRAWPELKDELGDLLLQVLFYAQMASEEGYFDIADVASALNAKLVRRHPHVFPVEGKLVDAADADAVVANWDAIKREEKRSTTAGAQMASGLDDIPRTMPAILEAAKIGSRAAKVGFDWPDATGLFAKLDEEIGELQAELVSGGTHGETANKERVEEEFGDLLFTAINLARHLKLDAESALRGANAKFRLRFSVMEQEAGGYDALSILAPEQLEALWKKAKDRAPGHCEDSEGLQR